MMSQSRKRRLARPVATPSQMFRALSMGAAFALMLAWTLRDQPAGATPAPDTQIVASR
jgi:hypothetical protein